MPESERTGARIYVFGGGLHEKVPVNDQAMYCLDLDKLFWVVISAPCSKSPSPRLGHSISVIGTKLYIFGGMDTDRAYDDLFVFDTITNSWSCPVTTGSKPSPRCAHAATVVGTKIYIHGGTILNGVPVVMDDLYSFDTGSLEWNVCKIKDSKPRLDSALTTLILGAENAEISLALFGGLNLEGIYNDMVIFNSCALNITGI